MPRIFTFIWNSQSVRLADVAQAEDRTSYFFNGNVPDFFPSLMEKIQAYQADIVVIALQECASPGCYFHSDFLPREMPKVGYELIHRTKMMGAGITTYKALYEFDIKFRGLRTSIYAKREYVETILSAQSLVVHNFGGVEREYVNSSVFRNKGGVAIYLRLPPFGTFAIINCHLPFSSSSLKDAVVRNDPMIRKNAVAEQNICFNEIYRKLVLGSEIKPQYVLYMGDFNYRLSTEGTTLTCSKLTSAIETKRTSILYRLCYEHMDELKKQMDGKLIYALQEGCNNEGPTFMPTGKLEKNRQEGYDQPTPEDDTGTFEPLTDIIRPQLFKIGSLQQRCPSYCDRILYQTVYDTDRPLRCIYYDRFDVGRTMKMSDHAGVIGVYEVN